MNNQQNNEFSPTDMATAAAEGYRTANKEGDSALLDYIEREWFAKHGGAWHFKFNETWDAGRFSTLRDAIRADMETRAELEE